MDTPDDGMELVLPNQTVCASVVFAEEGTNEFGSSQSLRGRLDGTGRNQKTTANKYFLLQKMYSNGNGGNELV